MKNQGEYRQAPAGNKIDGCKKGSISTDLTEMQFQARAAPG
jgi:hypothetical protein